MKCIFIQKPSNIDGTKKTYLTDVEDSSWSEDVESAYSFLLRSDAEAIIKVMGQGEVVEFYDIWTNKMYHLNPNDYGQGYFVLAKSKKQALEFIVKSQEYNTEMFIGKTIDNLPKKYTIDEHEEGVVIREEVC